MRRFIRITRIYSQYNSKPKEIDGRIIQLNYISTTQREISIYKISRGSSWQPSRGPPRKYLSNRETNANNLNKPLAHWIYIYKISDTWSENHDVTKEKVLSLESKNRPEHNLTWNSSIQKSFVNKKKLTHSKLLTNHIRFIDPRKMTYHNFSVHLNKNIWHGHLIDESHRGVKVSNKSRQ